MPFRKICKGCGCAFVADRRSKTFHSARCFALWRETQPAWQDAKKRGRALSVATQKRTRIQLYAERALRCATKGEAFYAGHRAGYPLGWKRGERVGYSKGFEVGYEQARRELRFANAMQLGRSA